MSDYVSDYDYYGIDNYEEFMKEFRYNICHIVTVEKAFPWLRHKRVLDESDEQSILREFKTNFLRTGHMVDILIRRGKKGCNALLEHIEYDYPEHFMKFTGKEPRDPSSEYQPHTTHYRPPSAVLLDQIWALNQQFMRSYMEERDTKKKLEHSLTQLDCQVKEFQKELDMKNQQISELSQKNLELKDRQKNLNERLELDRQDRIKCLDEYEELRKAKDEYQAKCAQIMTEKKNVARASIKQSSVRDKAYSNLLKENERLMKELSEYTKPTALDSQCSSAPGPLPDSEEKVSLPPEKEDLQEQLKYYIDMSEKNQQEYESQMVEMKEERDKVLEQFNGYKAKIEELQTENTALNEMVSNVSSDLRTMKNEAEIWSQRKRLQPMGPYRPNITKPYRPCIDEHLYYCIDDLHCEMIQPASDSDPDDPPIPGPREGRIPSGHQKDNSRPRRDAILRVPSVEREYPMRGSALIRIKQGSSGEVEYRRHSGPGKKKKPLALFAPKEIIHELEQCLLETKTFQQCPHERLESSDILTTWLEGGSCVHYTRTSGTQYDCIATQTLREYMQREDYARILLCVPPEVLVRMSNQQIYPLVLLVKYRHEEVRGEKSDEENELDRVHIDFQCTYEKVLIDKNDSLESVAKNINIKYIKISGDISRSTSTTSA